MMLRTAFAIFVGLAAASGGASAQYYPPGPYGAPPPPYAGQPMAADDDDGDVIPPSQQGIYSQPMPSPDGRTAPPYPGAPLPNAQQAMPGPGQQPPMQSRPADEWKQGLRPPADIDDSTSSVVTTQPGGAGNAPQGTGPGAPPPGGPVALLPPDDQPEQGPVKELPPQLRRQLVDYFTKEPAGTIIIDTPNTYLYLVLGENKAMRYGVGVGREGFTWAGREKISKMAEWPDWFPPAEMIERQPYLPRFMAGGESNPLGARALYLGKTLYRIHGTNQPSTIGTFVSSGCVRLLNSDIEDLYGRVKVGSRVVVLPGNSAAPPTAQNQAPPQQRMSPPVALNQNPQTH